MEWANISTCLQPCSTIDVGYKRLAAPLFLFFYMKNIGVFLQYNIVYQKLDPDSCPSGLQF